MAAPAPPHTAWVDCRPVVHFSKRVIQDLEGDSFRPTPAGGWGADWGGSARTKFLYRLRAVELLDAAGAVVEGSAEWPSNWWLPAGRPAIPAEGDAPSSEHEAWDLALLAWDLAPWARALSDGGAATEGDPATVVERLCDPVPETTRHCVYGADAERLEPDQVRFAATPTGGLPWRSGTALVGTETLGMPLDAALTWAGMLGFRYEPGAAAPLPAPWTAPDTGHEVTRVWQLPRYTHDEREPVTVGFDGTFEADVDDPELVVALSLPPPVTGEVELCTDFLELGDGGSPLPDVLEYFAFRITGHVGVVAVGYSVSFTGTLVIEIGGEFTPFSYGPATRVAARVVYTGSEPIRMRALDADGTLLGEAALPANVAPEVPYNLVIRRRGIARVELWAEPVPGGQLLLLDRLCIQLLIGVDDAIYLERVVAWFEEVGTLLAPSVQWTAGHGHPAVVSGAGRGHLVGAQGCGDRPLPTRRRRQRAMDRSPAHSPADAPGRDRQQLLHHDVCGRGR